MRLGLYQAASPAGDIDAALTSVRSALAAAVDDSVDMLALPEVFLPGYNSAAQTPPPGYQEAVEALPQLVAEHGVGLVVGVAEYTGGEVFNAAYAFGRDGARIASYRKVQLFGPRENALYRAGDALTTFDFEGRKLGLLICYDVEFPEHTRALARAGVEAILTPTANMHPFKKVNEITVPARAFESGLTIVYANYCGEEGDLRYTGGSLIAGPEGAPLATLGEASGLAAANLPNAAEAAAMTTISTQFSDYRPIGTIRHGWAK